MVVKFVNSSFFILVTLLCHGFDIVSLRYFVKEMKIDIFIGPLDDILLLPDNGIGVNFVLFVIKLVIKLDTVTLLLS